MSKKEKIILDLCGGSGAWSKPYKDAGYDVRLITLPDNDIRFYKPTNESIFGILAAPPCTEFSIARNNKQSNFEIGMEIVNHCLRIIKQSRPLFWCLENPKGFLRKFLGHPVFSFQPWEFGDPWTKRTDLWGDFNLPKIIYNEWGDVPKNHNLYIRPFREKPSIAFLHKSAQQFIPSFKNFNPKTDADFRAITPQGFAKAFFEMNK